MTLIRYLLGKQANITYPRLPPSFPLLQNKDSTLLFRQALRQATMSAPVLPVCPIYVQPFASNEMKSVSVLKELIKAEKPSKSGHIGASAIM